MRKEIIDLINYCCAFKGNDKNNSDHIRSLAENLYHTDLIVETQFGDKYNKEQWVAIEEGSSSRGAKIDFAGFELDGDDIEWKINIIPDPQRNSGWVMGFLFEGTVKDGKIYRFKKIRCRAHDISKPTPRRAPNSRRTNPLQSSLKSSRKEKNPLRVSWKSSLVEISSLQKNLISNEYEKV
mmetsp:Transcript_44536/g.93454  ORF Transcript_44536/g.93454 Transcript_44536/m.93454 type:complete len:181 (+) Transcript_44536:173-715(+)|eukprot:CAMPEP_0183736230 /NCGR_PEP_ID=MMETSP0737-20130205/48826_1 /TAXON_ID=385413 /ORGANISM="Thalassiosira miniscula, Strain CCMP1093" /LENGTH=180 /DNA_ID=CAMNT_0025970179 /DNA_START=152 /DNA_END=694 /DNA_ORIENTATION=+